MDDDPGALPPPSVLLAWDVSDPVRLSGGQGLTFAAGGLVLKRAGDMAQAVWIAEVLDTVRADDGRVIRPVRSRLGTWVVDGWSAWHWLDGEHWSDAWDDVLEVSARFHRAVADVSWSPALAASHRWAVADRVAWGEAGGDLPQSVTPLLALRRPVDLPCQLVHGDLGGNVLFSDGQPPAVIDVSPYWRPAGYADAIVVADAVAWFGAGHDLVERLLRAQGIQLLLRAVLFRVATDPEFAPAYASLGPLITA
ncbi:TIGR02569 family protein [Jannaschia sp. R86511]|uniref:TIGR02569 family protein n=1 Tax=Jannaschia sp. R86511 TaxID=3093853 RepID=UPI0036D37E57